MPRVCGTHASADAVSLKRVRCWRRDGRDGTGTDVAPTQQHGTAARLILLSTHVARPDEVGAEAGEQLHRALVAAVARDRDRRDAKLVRPVDVRAWWSGTGQPAAMAARVEPTAATAEAEVVSVAVPAAQQMCEQRGCQAAGSRGPVRAAALLPGCTVQILFGGLAGWRAVVGLVAGRRAHRLGRAPGLSRRSPARPPRSTPTFCGQPPRPTRRGACVRAQTDNRASASVYAGAKQAGDCGAKGSAALRESSIAVSTARRAARRAAGCVCAAWWSAACVQEEEHQQQQQAVRVAEGAVRRGATCPSQACSTSAPFSARTRTAAVWPRAAASQSGGRPRSSSRCTTACQRQQRQQQ